MRRKLFNLAAVVSLVLCVAVVTLWALSYWYLISIGLFVPSASGTFAVVVNDGRLILKADRFIAPLGRGMEVYMRSSAADPSLNRVHSWVENGYWAYEGLGFGVAYPGMGFNASRLQRYVAIAPFWFVAVVFAVPLAWAVRAMRRHMPTPNCCSSCGYDLRATPERCPECGAEAVRAK